VKADNNITVLIPTYQRLPSLAVTLTSLFYQTEKNFDVVSDQSSDYDVAHNALIQAVARLLRTGGHDVTILKNLPRRGMAQQRQFLLEQCNGPFALFLDDDLMLEPFVVANMRKVIMQQQCGFVGCAVIGLSFEHDVRPHQQAIEMWHTPVQPETVLPNGDGWQRYQLHNAANLYHVQQNLESSAQHPQAYKVAWVGGCTLYDIEKLKQAGGFEFWKELPEQHCGEDVLAQLRVMRQFGGCGIIPSGVYHQELQTTVPDRKLNAPEYLAI